MWNCSFLTPEPTHRQDIEKKEVIFLRTTDLFFWKTHFCYYNVIMAGRCILDHLFRLEMFTNGHRMEAIAFSLGSKEAKTPVSKKVKMNQVFYFTLASLLFH
ncbi:hypothetical protein CUU64_06700 [Bacillus sp. V5-8f]|nr:hypothetical protein CUU64_06700 [Bacillus sp. V5-8f]